MGKSSPSTPAAPDPQQLAANQAQANIGTARVQQRLNMIDENTPWYQTTYTSLGDRTRNPDGSPVAAAASGASSGGATPASASGMSQERWDSMDPSWQAAYPDQNPGGSTATGGSSRTPGTAASMEGEPEYYNQDRYSRSITLNPEDQKILDQQRRLTQGIGGMAEGQLPRIQGALNQTVDYSGLPENVTGVDTSRLQAVDPTFRSGQIQSGLDFSGLPGLSSGFDSGGNIQRSVADAGAIQKSVDPGDQWSYNDVGGPQRSLNIQDPTAFTKGVNDTLYGAASSRFEPQIAQEREQLRQSLADRGIPEDSPAAQRELTRFDQQAGDTRLQASASATDRAAAQAAQLFGLDLSRFNAENAAQGQQFSQTAMQRGDLLNQGLSLGNFANQAQGQQFGQNLASMQAANQAQQQQYGQNMGQAEFGNSARQQMANELTTQGQFANSAQQQGYGQDLARQQLALQLRQQGLSEQEVNAALAAQARQSGYTERQNVRTQPITDALALLGAQ